MKLEFRSGTDVPGFLRGGKRPELLAAPHSLDKLYDRPDVQQEIHQLAHGAIYRAKVMTTSATVSTMNSTSAAVSQPACSLLSSQHSRYTATMTSAMTRPV